MTHPETSVPFGGLRPAGTRPVSLGSFEWEAAVDSPAALPVSASTSKVTALPAAPPAFTVTALLVGGGRLDLGTFGDRAHASRAARLAMRSVRAAGDDWAILDGNYVRPDAVLAIEVGDPA